MNLWLCGRPGCKRPVRGIYCYAHRLEMETAARAIQSEKSERMKTLWKDRREELLSKIAAGRAPALEGIAPPVLPVVE